MTQTWTLSSAVSSNKYDWGTAANWGGTPPGSTDAAEIPVTFGSPYVVYIDSFAGASVADLTINDANATVQVDGLGSGLTVADSLNFNAGTISLDEGNVLQVGGDAAPAAPNGVMTIGAGAVVIGDGTFDGGGGILVLNATASTDGTIVFAGGTLVAAAGASNTLEVIGNIVAGNLQIAGNAALALDSTGIDPASVVTFTGGATATGVLIDNRSANPFGAETGALGFNISGMDVGSGNAQLDSIEIAGDLSATASFSSGVITITTAAGTDSFTLAGNYAGDVVNMTSDGTNSFVFLDSVCFVSGTRIRTLEGDCAVELLQAGDLVAVVQDGNECFQPVKWIGYRTINLAKHPRLQHSAPIRFARGALDENLPVRDLSVSPDHCLFLDGKLIPAKLLVNGMTIRQDLELSSVAYYHVELERHSVLLAEGVAAESYLDTGNRAFFSNAGLALILHPEFHVNAGLRCWATDACAPLAVSPNAVLPVWRPLAERAVALGYIPPNRSTTTDADIHLIADGHRIDTVAVKGQLHSFMVPAGITSLILASRTVKPNVLTPYVDDQREIGVAVHGVVIRGLDAQAEYPADHPALSRGWHAPERADGALWRWSMGNGALPISFEDGPVVVEVTIGLTTTYLIDDVRLDTRIAA